MTPTKPLRGEHSEICDEIETFASEFGYPTVESTLRTADAILGKGADSVWIVDREGNLILPADQVRLRLSPRPSAPTHP